LRPPSWIFYLRTISRAHDSCFLRDTAVMESEDSKPPADVLETLAISNYRSLRQLVTPLARISLITGPNGSGKSSVYRALRLLADTAQGGVIASLAREGGIGSTTPKRPPASHKWPRTRPYLRTMAGTWRPPCRRSAK
jgi:hypothetical protein